MFLFNIYTYRMYASNHVIDFRHQFWSKVVRSVFFSIPWGKFQFGADEYLREYFLTQISYANWRTFTKLSKCSLYWRQFCWLLNALLTIADTYLHVFYSYQSTHVNFTYYIRVTTNEPFHCWSSRVKWNKYEFIAIIEFCQHRFFSSHPPSSSTPSLDPKLRKDYCNNGRLYRMLNPLYMHFYFWAIFCLPALPCHTCSMLDSSSHVRVNWI